MNTIIGRKEELRILASAFNSKQSEFIAVFGRRRVGKTFLLHYYFSSLNCIYFHVTGIRDGTYSEQLETFTSVLGNTFYNGAQLERPKNWFKAFELLTNAISKIKKNKKVVLFFDEFPWMATRRSKLLQVLEYHWNHTWAFDGRIKLIVCGSSTSWILRNIVHNTGGLYNRVTVRVGLEPFNLAETEEYLKFKDIDLSHKRIAELYMTMGGIPFYLSQIPKGYSVPQVIDKLFFNKKSTLYNEYKLLLAALFEHSEDYDKILRIIAKYRYGISQTDLFKKERISKGGRSLLRLDELEDVGFIRSFIPMGKKERGKFYKIVDEYILFYLHWIEAGLRTASRSTNLWQGKALLPAWKSWTGYAFEALCYKHFDQVAIKLEIGIADVTFSWRSFPNEKENLDGAQIDLVFDRDDGAVTLCEIKYSEQPFVLDKEYVDKIQRKIDVFKKTTRTKKQVLFAMIVANGIQKNMYSEMIDNVVTLEDLFKKVK